MSQFCHYSRVSSSASVVEVVWESKYRAVQYSAVQYSRVQYSTVLWSRVTDLISFSQKEWFSTFLRFGILAVKNHTPWFQRPEHIFRRRKSGSVDLSWASDLFSVLKHLRATVTSPEMAIHWLCVIFIGSQKISGFLTIISWSPNLLVLAWSLWSF